MKKILTLILTCIAISTFAEPAIRFGMDEGPYYKNTAFRFQVQVENASDDLDVSFPDSIDGFTVKRSTPASNTSSQISIINGKRTEKHTTTTLYTFFLTPKKEGKLTIPECTITTNGDTKKIPARSIQVIAPETKKDLVDIEFLTDKTTCALGEPLLLTLRLIMRESIQNYQLEIPLLESDVFDFKVVEPDENRNPLAMHNTIVLTTTGGMKLPAVGRQSRQGAEVYVFRINAIPRKPGNWKFDGASLICDVVDRTSPKRKQRQSPFGGFPFEDDPFFGGTPYNTRKCSAESPKIEITVKEPPKENRPIAYAGLAEPCTITVEADKTSVYVGDPIILSITIKGPRFLNAVKLPRIGEQPNFKENFRVFDNDAPGEIAQDESAITFKRTIRAATDAVKEIPPLEIAWYDANENRYDTTKSEPIPITVQPSRKAAPVVMTSTALSSPEKSTVTATSSARGNFPASDCIINQFKKSNGNSPALPEIIFLAAVPICCMGLWGIMRYAKHRKNNTDVYRKRGAARSAAKLLQHIHENDTNAYQKLIDVLHSFIADKTLRNVNTITFTDVEQYLKAHHVSNPTIATLRTVVNACEEALYTKHSSLTPAQAINQMTSAFDAVLQEIHE